MYKLICLDIDGTLLDKDRDLSLKTKSVFERIDNDVVVILASSRMPSAMSYLQKGLKIEHYPMICYNGGLIIEPNGHIIDNQAIPIACMEALLPFHQRCNLSLYIADDWYTDREDSWTKREINNTRVQPTIRLYEQSLDAFKKATESPQKIMCMGDKEIIDQIDSSLNRLEIKVNRYRSKDTYLEITAQSTNKALALDQLITKKYVNIKPSEIIAFGDNYNDIDLLKYVGCGVAMRNGRDELKTKANRVAPSNVDDGVALTLEEVYQL